MEFGLEIANDVYLLAARAGTARRLLNRRLCHMLPHLGIRLPSAISRHDQFGDAIHSFKPIEGLRNNLVQELLSAMISARESVLKPVLKNDSSSLRLNAKAKAVWIC